MIHYQRIIKFLLPFILLFDIVFASEIDLNSERYILYNMNDNEVLMEKDAHKEVSIASLTKIMTVIVAIENIDNFDDKITITNKMIDDIEWDVSTAGFKVGEKLTYNDLLYGAILPSGADAVNALAVSISNDKNKFVELMNQKVEELGLQNTHFANVIGLYDKNNYSSAYDMAQILIYALKNPKFKEVFETRKYTYSNGRTTKSTLEWYNTKNKENISYITGAKTGYIRKSGYCLASTATIDNVNYLLITLNAFSTESGIHIKDHIKAYKYFSSNYSYKNIVDYDSKVITLKTKYSKEENIDILANIKIEKYLKNDFDKSKVEYKYYGVDTISYFTKKGVKLGKVEIIYDGEKYGDFDLIYSQALTFNLIGFLSSNIVLIITIIVLTLLLIASYKEKHKNNVKKTNN